jgi:NOL1/NOP2/sun family putative RNA methylase
LQEKKIALPDLFLGRMKQLLGEDDYAEFVSTCSAPHYRGIRINTLKFPLENADKLGLTLQTTPFSDEGFLVLSDEKFGAMPLYHAGAFYSQEPSAMSAVTALDPRKGERILNMCASPGGKSTHIAAKLAGEGMLWSNEYVRTRIPPLLSNLERMGVRNSVVSSLSPSALAERFAGCFDRVLADAPCSGEGMMRRDGVAVAEWSYEHVLSCANRQKAILSDCAKCVREGGILVYSTCTFSREENEEVILSFLESHPDFVLQPIDSPFGRSGMNISDKFDLTQTRRIYPMDGGEGHFVAKMKKVGGASAPISLHNKKSGTARKNETADCSDGMVREFFSSCFKHKPVGAIREFGGKLYLIPNEEFDVAKGSIRAGVLIGEVRKNRIIPAHSLFTAFGKGDFTLSVDLEPNGEEIRKFLLGEEISAPAEFSGYCAVCCGGLTMGFGKCSNGRLKNHYPKGLRVNVY